MSPPPIISLEIVRTMYTKTNEIQIGKRHLPSNLGPSLTKPWQRLQKPKIGYTEIILIDFVLLNICLWAEVYAQIYIGLDEHLTFTPFVVFIVLGNLLWIVVAAFTDIYDFYDESRLSLRIRDLFVSSIIYFGILSLIYDYFFFGLLGFNFLLPSLLAFLGVASITHYAIRSYHQSHSQLLLYAMIGGAAPQIRQIKKLYANNYGPNSFCVGRFGDDKIKGTRDLGGFDLIKSYVTANLDKISKLIYLQSNFSNDEIQELVQLCRNNFVEFEVVPMEVHFFNKGVRVDQSAQFPILGRKREPLCQIKNQILKRVFDITFSLAVILLIFPWLFPIIALAIKLESTGPIFFLQSRSGYWNKPFRLIKFRTMCVNSECNAKQAKKGDNRITRVGAFLRKTSLDELPQFINVLSGEMSIVGPRPHMLKHTEDYAKLIRSFMIRHEVKPGITGWAQVNGWRGPTEEVYKMAKRVEFDVDYIEGWNFWFDCKCIFLTTINAIRGEENAV